MPKPARARWAAISDAVSGITHGCAIAGSVAAGVDLHPVGAVRGLHEPARHEVQVAADREEGAIESIAQQGLVRRNRCRCREAKIDFCSARSTFPGN